MECDGICWNLLLKPVGTCWNLLERVGTYIVTCWNLLERLHGVVIGTFWNLLERISWKLLEHVGKVTWCLTCYCWNRCDRPKCSLQRVATWVAWNSSKRAPIGFSMGAPIARERERDRDRESKRAREQESKRASEQDNERERGRERERKKKRSVYSSLRRSLFFYLAVSRRKESSFPCSLALYLSRSFSRITVFSFSL